MHCLLFINLVPRFVSLQNEVALRLVPRVSGLFFAAYEAVVVNGCPAVSRFSFVTLHSIDSIVHHSGKPHIHSEKKEKKKEKENLIPCTLSGSFTRLSSAHERRRSLRKMSARAV